MDAVCGWEFSESWDGHLATSNPGLQQQNWEKAGRDEADLNTE